jgi:hypothetical protein
LNSSLYPHDLVLAVGWVVVARRGWLGLAVLPRFLFFFFPVPVFALKLPQQLSGLRIASSSLLSAGHLPSSDIISLFHPLIFYQLTVVGCVSLAGPIFLHNVVIYFGQFVRLRLFSISNVRATSLILSKLRFFVVFIELDYVIHCPSLLGSYAGVLYKRPIPQPPL